MVPLLSKLTLLDGKCLLGGFYQMDFTTSGQFVCSTDKYIKVTSPYHQKYLEIDTEKTGQANFGQELRHIFFLRSRCFDGIMDYGEGQINMVDPNLESKGYRKQPGQDETVVYSLPTWNNILFIRNFHSTLCSSDSCSPHTMIGPGISM